MAKKRSDAPSAPAGHAYYARVLGRGYGLAPDLSLALRRLRSVVGEKVECDVFVIPEDARIDLYGWVETPPDHNA